MSAAEGWIGLAVAAGLVLYLLACDPLPPCTGKVRDWLRAMAAAPNTPAIDVAGDGGARVHVHHHTIALAKHPGPGPADGADADGVLSYRGEGEGSRGRWLPRRSQGLHLAADRGAGRPGSPRR